MHMRDRVHLIFSTDPPMFLHKARCFDQEHVDSFLSGEDVNEIRPLNVFPCTLGVEHPDSLLAAQQL
jgi:hypothetical protein